MFVLRMGGVADGVEIFGISRRTADVFRRTPTGGLEREGKCLCGRVVEPFFELDHMVPAVAEVIEIMDRLGAGLANDIAEPRLAGIDRLGGRNHRRDRGCPNVLRRRGTRRGGCLSSQTPPAASDAADQGAG